jgi:transcriptional regulator with XRE-family HTH domain
MDHFAARLRAARAFAGLSQEELAEALGDSVSTIARRETGKSPTKPGDRISTATVCGVPPEFMEQGFGVIAQDEILERLARIEAALIGNGTDPVNLEPVHTFVRSVVSELGEGRDSGEVPAPISARETGPRSEDTGPPRVRSHRRS